MWIRDAFTHDRRQGIEIPRQTSTRGKESLTSVLKGWQLPSATGINLPIALPGVILCVARQTMYMIKTSRIAATTAAGMLLSHSGTERPFLIATLKTRAGSRPVRSRGRTLLVASGEATIVSSPSETASVLAVAGVLPEGEILGANRRVSAAAATFSVGRGWPIVSCLPTSVTRTRVFSAESAFLLPG